MRMLDERSLRLHVPVLGWQYIVANGVILVAGILAMVFLRGIGVAVRDPTAYQTRTYAGIAAPAPCALVALPRPAAGDGLPRLYHRGRSLALVVGILGSAAFPISTMLGLHAFFVLLQDQDADDFAVQPST
jgi:hypothetical protein